MASDDTVCLTVLQAHPSENSSSVTALELFSDPPLLGTRKMSILKGSWNCLEKHAEGILTLDALFLRGTVVKNQDYAGFENHDVDIILGAILASKINAKFIKRLPGAAWRAPGTQLFLNSCSNHV